MWETSIAGFDSIKEKARNRNLVKLTPKEGTNLVIQEFSAGLTRIPFSYEDIIAVSQDVCIRSSKSKRTAGEHLATSTAHKKRCPRTEAHSRSDT